MAVDDTGEDVLSDEICRRWKQQRRRRGGRSVQPPNWFMNMHSSWRLLCTYTYHVLRTTKCIRLKHPPEVRSRDGHVEHLSKNSGSTSSKRRGHLDFYAESMRILRSCLEFLDFSVGSGFCVMFHLTFNIDRSDVQMYSRNILRTDMPWSTWSRLVQNKNGKKKFFVRKFLTIFGLLDGLWSVRTRFRQ